MWSFFAANGSNTFINVSRDNRVHLWDAETRREKRSYVEKNNLAHSYTCAAWKPGIKESLGYFAVGASDGTVILWELSRGVVAKVFGVANDSPAPTSLAFANDGSSLLVTSTRSDVMQYNISDGKTLQSFSAGKRGALKIAINPKVDAFAVGGNSIRLVDMISGRKKKLTAAFSGGIEALAFTQCGKYLVASGSGSREILIFDVQVGGSDVPLAAVPVKGVPRVMHARTVEKRYIEVLCIFEDSDSAFLRYTFGLEVEEIATSVCYLKTSSEVMAACFGRPGQELNGGNEVTLAIGQQSNPFFVTVDVIGADGALLSDVVVEGPKIPDSAEAETSDAPDAKAVVAPIMLGPHEYGGSKRPIVGELGPEKKQKRDGGDVEEDTAELTLEQRLESLSANMAELENGFPAHKVAAASVSDENPTSDSLTTLMEQALHTGDDSLLEQCFTCDDVAVVEATTKRLTSNRVVQLLRKLVAKFEKRPSRGLQLIRWLGAVLKHHTSFLISVPDLSNQLAGLSQMLEQRLSSYLKLASLGGRLDLLMSQVTTQSRAVSDGAGSQSKKRKSNTEPQQIYVEE